VTCWQSDLSGYPRKHLTAALLAKPVALLTATELRKWRDGLKLGKPGVNKVCKNIAAALALAAKADQRIRNKTAWTVGLAGASPTCIGAQRHPRRRHGAEHRRGCLWSKPFRELVGHLKLPANLTPYALRHSSKVVESSSPHCNHGVEWSGCHIRSVGHPD
jgi:hypothetical protein